MSRTRLFSRGPRLTTSRGHEELVELAKQNKAPHAEEWIRDHLTNKEAALLYCMLREDESLVPELLGKLPSESVVLAAKLKCKAKDAAENSMLGRLLRRRSAPPPQGTSWDRTVKESEAFTYTKNIISAQEEPVFFSETLIEPRSVKYVSRLMGELLKPKPSARKHGADVCGKWHNDIQELVNEIAPFIYGSTPMCMAMYEALRIFKQTCVDTMKVLFILSDGQSTDGDPLPIAEELRALGVCIVTCYLTSDHIVRSLSLN